jgi:predicted KAP-like P-loop ATPase
MWSDKETAEDLLGYSAHAKLLESVVTNEKNLPITVGLYGDWGSGKSSILKILEKRLKKDDDAVVIYFDGWSFESFDDAKMALIQGIVDALEDDEKFFDKLGDIASDEYKSLKNAFKNIRKSINWMRVLKITAKTAIPIATATATGGASLIIPALLSVFSENKDNLVELLTGNGAEKFLNDAINQESEDKKYKVVREFRHDFEELIDKSKKGKIVILIDDLDRCLPRHIIENLEAIKLFLNVPKTAFVIAADKFIVSNAIKSEYKEIINASNGDNVSRNIGESYMEKFIQLPYTIPILSPKEVETYVTLLFCESILDKDTFDKVQKDFSKFIDKNKFVKYGWSNINSLLQGSAPNELFETIGFISRFSIIIGNSLKWNPRLIKRFLNAYEIRASLLAQSDIVDNQNKFALLKLMLIEQKYIEQFKKLNSWVMGNVNTSSELIELEKLSEDLKQWPKDYADWNQRDLKFILSTEPKFSSIDMKQLFWVSRDNIIDQMSGVSLISARLKSAFNLVYNATSDPLREKAYRENISALSQDELSDLFELIDAKLLINPKDNNAYNIYICCILNDTLGAYNHFLDILSRIDTTSISMGLGNKFKDILTKYNGDTKLLSLLKGNMKLIKTIKS